MNALWLVSWFPNRSSPYNGDFIERHANAVSPFLQNLFIIAVIKDEALKYGEVNIEKVQKDNQIIYRVYYGRSRWKGIAEKLSSYKKYISLQRKVYGMIVKEYGKPDLVHVHVPMKAGLFALQLKKKFAIPYIVTEHWAGYIKEAKYSIYEKGRLFTWLNNRILEKADLFTPVSRDLGKIISGNFVKLNYEVVPNVLDSNIFHPEERTGNDVLHLIHVSNMGYQKNPELLIEAASILKREGTSFLLHLFGPVQVQLQQMVMQNGLADIVKFKGEVPQATIALAMQQADALILCSRYETFGCVLIEANACGLPVIVSNLAVFHELVKDGVNGVVMQQNTAHALADSIRLFSKNRSSFNRQSIAENAMERFNYAVIGKKIFSIYTDLVKMYKK